MRLLNVAEVCDISGASPRQLRHWVERGFVKASQSKWRTTTQPVFDPGEVAVVVLMVRLIDAGWHDLAKIEAMARKHFSDVDTLRAMGYDGVSVATEHTVGEGLVLTIT
jgi:hypothetical protein